MDYRPYKFVIAPVIQVVNDEGEVVNELGVEKPTTVFGLKGLREFADQFEAELLANIAEMDGSK